MKRWWVAIVCSVVCFGVMSAEAQEPPDAGASDVPADEDDGIGPGQHVPPGPGGLEPALDVEVIRRVVRAKLAPIRRCYEKALKVTPDLNARIAPRFVIGPDGSVTLVELEGDPIPPGLERCLKDALRSMRFPPPATGGNVEIRYPFNIDPWE